MTVDATIRVHELVVEHPTAAGPFRALDCDELLVPAGTSAAVMGPSGCGKSTLLGVLAGLAAPTSGSVSIGATEITALAERDRVAFRKHTIGVVYQADNLLPFMTVAENVGLQLALCEDTVDAAARIQALLDRLGIGALADRLPDELSGGQRQRAAVARGVVHRPAVILADEPTGALDGSSASAVLDLLVEAREALGATLVLVTHDPVVAAGVGRVVTLQDGSVVRDEEVVDAA